MSKRHAFNQAEVFMLSTRVGQYYKDQTWDRFVSIANDFGFKVRVTGGNFLTHEVDCDGEDFIALLELTKYN